MSVSEIVLSSSDYAATSVVFNLALDITQDTSSAFVSLSELIKALFIATGVLGAAKAAVVSNH